MSFTDQEKLSKFIRFLELCIFGSTNPRKILLYAETPPGMIIEKGKLSIQRNWLIQMTA